jgi:hypothetical protein
MSAHAEGGEGGWRPWRPPDCEALVREIANGWDNIGPRGVSSAPFKSGATVARFGVIANQTQRTPLALLGQTDLA